MAAEWPEVSADAPVRVARGAVLAGVVGGVSGAVMATLRPGPVQPPVVVARVAKHWFLFSFGFFAVREYITKPLLSSSASPTGSHLHDLVPTLASGAAMGALSSAVTKRPVASSIVTLSLLCGALQIAGNEFSLVTRYLAAHAVGADERVSPGEKVMPAAALPSTADGCSADAVTAAAPPPTDASAAPRGHGPTLAMRAWDALKRNSPIQPIDDADYRKRLLERRQHLQAEMVLLEADLALRRKHLQEM
ncbi:hypothetical protein MSPP1_002693 [Malassezia sp. CBS 17886]|nr:hypothetical protein MSPP1_002693 [Malassezia sp. CBS 17886]